MPSQLYYDLVVLIPKGFMSIFSALKRREKRREKKNRAFCATDELNLLRLALSNECSMPCNLI